MPVSVLALLSLLHPVADLSASRFSVHPSVAIGIAAFAALYVWRARQANGTDARLSSLQRVSFFTALALLFVTLNGPLHDLSDFYLFSAHMVQHLILTLVVPPLMLIGTPGWMLRPLLRTPWVAALAKRVTSVGACFTIFNVVLAAWHLPPLYNLALAVHAVHILQHLLFIAASVLMWWPILSPLPELPRASYPAQMLYCFLMVIPMSIISIYVAMADTLLYPAYAAAPRILAISPMQDQQYGGLIMWIPGGVFFYAVMTVVFFKWSQRGEDDVASAQVGWTPSATPPTSP
jgi:putative membrane protein